MTIIPHSQWEADRARIEKLETGNLKLIEANPHLTSDQKREEKTKICSIVQRLMTDFLVLTAGLHYDNLSKQEADRKFANSSSEVNRHMKALMAKEQAAKTQELRRETLSQTLREKIETLNPVTRPSLSFLKAKTPLKI